MLGQHLLVGEVMLCVYASMWPEHSEIADVRAHLELLRNGGIVDLMPVLSCPYKLFALATASLDLDIRKVAAHYQRSTSVGDCSHLFWVEIAFVLKDCLQGLFFGGGVVGG